MLRCDCRTPVSGSFDFLFPSLIPCCSICLCSVSGSPNGGNFSVSAPGVLPSVSSQPFLCRETCGSPKFPDCPREHMTWSQTPVETRMLATPGLFSLLNASGSAAFRPLNGVGFCRRKSDGLSFSPRLYPFRGSIQTLHPRLPQLRTSVAGFARAVGFRPVGYTLVGWDSRCATVSFPNAGASSAGGRFYVRTFPNAEASLAGGY
jgi:hypothetical protein